MESQVAVLIPVYDGFGALERCLEAVARHTPARCEVVLVDDASTDARVAPLLAKFAAARAGSRVLSNPRNLGFTGAVNRGLAETAGDVIVLNSDTVVTEGWVEGLERCRDSDPRIGIACPLSNRATILSIPGIEALFARAGGDADVEAIGRCVREASTRAYPALPTAVGFCMLLTRAAIAAAGPLDPAYGRGYGEECDFSMRALDLGMRIACCDDVYVHHESGVSFGAVADLEAERALNTRMLDRRWPMYTPGVKAWSLANPLRPAIERVIAAAERGRRPGKPRVLQVLHRFDSRGGVEEHTRAIIDGLAQDATFTVALPSTRTPAWGDMVEERIAPHLRVVRLNTELASAGLRVMGHRSALRDAGIEAAFRALLSGGFDIVHLQSLVEWNTLALPRIARESGARVVLSAHDMAMMCADYNMMALSDDRPCGRTHARGTDEGCVPCLRAKSEAGAIGLPPVSAYIDERHALAADAIAASDAVVAPSAFVAARLLAAFGRPAGERCRVIGHGVRAFTLLDRDPARPMLTVAFVGRFTGRKGAREVIAAARALAGQRIVFEIHGLVDDPLVPLVRAAGMVMRGAYRAAELQERLRGVDLVVAPSLAEETFCLVLGEAQRLGVPVVASDRGAPKERIREGETGFIVPAGDAAALAGLLLRLRDDRGALESVAARLRLERPATLESNAAQYLALYRSLATAPVPPPSVASDADKVERVFNLPRSRARTPLGDERYDRWMAAERESETPARDAGPLPCLIRFARAGDEPPDLAALNREIAASAAPWVAFAQDGDTLAAGALHALAQAAREHPQAVLLYTDDDAVSTRGERYDPLFKPAFDPELLRHEPYIAGLCAVRRDALVDRGGLRSPGWHGIAAFALALANESRLASVARVPFIGVHRLDTNLRALDREESRRRLFAPGADQPPAAGGAGVLVECHDTPFEVVERCVGSLLRRPGERIAEIFLDIASAQVAAISTRFADLGAVPMTSLQRPALAQAVSHSRADWLVIVDARCDEFAPDWLAQLQPGASQHHVAAVAPALRQRGGTILPGWEVVGGGPWSVAGAAPLPDASRLSTLQHAPHEAGALAGRLVMLRCSMLAASGALADVERAGDYRFTHISLALRAAGRVLLSRPHAAAIFEGPVEAPVRRAAMDRLERPEDAAWMRERWGAALDSDPAYPAELALDEARPRAALRFGARVAGDPVRLCAFPFDRGGSGEMRVRQPVAALEAANRVRAVLMPEHDAGAPPNALAWRRLDADAMYALNFFHDHQLRMIDEYARVSPALRVLGMDDLLTDLPPANPYARTIYPDIAARIRVAVAKFDRLVVSTPGLAEAYGSGARDVRVIPNGIDLARWPTPRVRAERARPRVGWAGAAQHLDDLRAIAGVVEATRDEFEWVFLGLCPPELRPFAAAAHPMVPVGRFPARLAALDLDIAVAPLIDHPFNRAKSNLKLLEYGALALPVVASDITPYRGAPVVLAGADPAGWVDALRMVASEPGHGSRRGQALRAWVEEHGTLQLRLEAWSAALRDR